MLSGVDVGVGVKVGVRLAKAVAVAFAGEIVRTGVGVYAGNVERGVRVAVGAAATNAFSPKLKKLIAHNVSC